MSRDVFHGHRECDRYAREDSISTARDKDRNEAP